MSAPSSTSESDSPPIAGEYGRTLTTTTGYVTSFSGVLAGGLAVVGLLILAVIGGSIGEAISGLLLGGIIAISVAGIGTTDIFGSIGGGLGVLIGTAATGGLLFASVRSGTPGVTGLTIGAVVIGFGIARFRVDAFGEGAISQTVGLLLRVATMFALLGLLFVLLGADLQVLASTVGTAALAELISPTTQSGRIIGFVLTAWLAFIGIWMVIVVSPPTTTLPESWQPRYEQILRRVKTNAAVVLAVGSIVVATVYFVSIDTGVGSGIVAPTIGGVVRSTAVRIAFLRLFFLGIAGAVTIGLGRVLGVNILFGDTDWSIAGVELTAALFAVAVLGTGPAIESLMTVSAVPTEPASTLLTVLGATAVGLLVAMGAILGLATGLSVLPALCWIDVIPAQTAGSRLVVGGLLTSAVVSAHYGSSAVAVIAAVTAAVVVWDLTTFGSGICVDLGVTASHRATDQLHAAASVGIGVLLLGGTTLVYWLIRGQQVSEEGAVFAVLLTAIVLVAGSLLFAFDTQYS